MQITMTQRYLSNEYYKRATYLSCFLSNFFFPTSNNVSHGKTFCSGKSPTESRHISIVMRSCVHYKFISGCWETTINWQLMAIKWLVSFWSRKHLHSNLVSICRQTAHSNAKYTLKNVLCVPVSFPSCWSNTWLLVHQLTLMHWKAFSLCYAMNRIIERDGV